MNESSIRSENCRFDRRAIAIETAPIKRNSNDMFEVQINRVGCHGVRESIERLLQRNLEFSDDTYDSVDSRLVHQTARSINEQTDVFVKLDIRRQYYVVHSIDLHSCHNNRSDAGELMFRFHVWSVWLVSSPLPTGFATSRSSGTPSHSAASFRSWNTCTLIDEP